MSGSPIDAETLAGEFERFQVVDVRYPNEWQAGHIDGADLADVVRDAGAPVVVDTPGGVEGQAADIAWLRELLG